MISQNWSKLKPQFAKNPRPKCLPDPPSKLVRRGRKTKRSKHPEAVSQNRLLQWVGLELGRWDVMDEVVAGYDLHISPSLGGADSKRNEQKRKRHLEAWLWARMFHPLLPLGEPSPEALKHGDEQLLQKLVNAGVSKKEARARIRKLAIILSSEIVPATDIRVQVDDPSSDLIKLRCGKRTVEVLPRYFAKLRDLHVGSSLQFHLAVFLVLARYRVLQVHDKGGGNQGALPASVFGVLQKWTSEPVIEAFASPLNTLAGAGYYHSAFSDVDSLFGSRGSFFEASILEGVVEVNPPFDEAIVWRTAVFCQQCLERATADKKMLVFVVVIPETEWPGHAEFLRSQFLRRSITLLAGNHFYQVGNQHLNHCRTYPASRNTSLLLLSSRPLAGANALCTKLHTAFQTQAAATKPALLFVIHPLLVWVIFPANPLP
eukprot:s1697_g9.t2